MAILSDNINHKIPLPQQCRHKPVSYLNLCDHVKRFDIQASRFLYGTEETLASTNINKTPVGARSPLVPIRSGFFPEKGI